MALFRTALLALGALVFICVALRLTDTRVLIFERKVNPGDKYQVEGWGELGDSGSPSLVCKYFTGTDVTVQVYWYSASNVMGRGSSRSYALPNSCLSR